MEATIWIFSASRDLDWLQRKELGQVHIAKAEAMEMDGATRRHRKINHPFRLLAGEMLERSVVDHLRRFILLASFCL